MSQADDSTSLDLQEQVLHLRQVLQMRDQLVDQLSAELFNLIQDKSNLTEGSKIHPRRIPSIQKQFQVVKQQLALHREEIASRNAEIAQLQQSVQELNQHNSLLEQALQELPEAYRQNFAERIRPIRQKLVMLQQENHQLQARLQSANYRLEARTHYRKQVQLPNFSRPPGYSNADTFSRPPASPVKRTLEDS